MKEEEQPGGMFAKARKSTMDLPAIGERMRARKSQLMNGSSREQPLYNPKPEQDLRV